MRILITLDDVRQIKKQLGERLPGVKSSHRVEAMARGLGWKSNAALRACLLCAPTQCMVDDAPFERYLAERGFPRTPEKCFSSTVVRMVMAQHNQTAREPAAEAVIAGRPSLSTVLFGARGRAGFVGAILCLAFYLAVGLQVARGAMEQNIDTLLTMAQGPASHAVLVLDAEEARRAVSMLTGNGFVRSARVLNDHGQLMAAVQVPEDGQAPFSVTGLLVPAGTVTATRLLTMPADVDGDGRIEITYDRARAMAAGGGATGWGAALFLILGWFLGRSADRWGGGKGRRLIAAPRRRLQAYLMAHYRLKVA